MTIPVVLAFTAALLVILSRQVNGRLALSSTPLVSSFWNYCVGFVFLSPSRGEERFACVKSTIGEFPSEFVRTSPIFCDFAELDVSKIERVPNRPSQLLACTTKGFADPDAWMNWASVVVSD